MVYEDYDLYRNVEDRNCILMHPEDIDRLGVAANARVTIHGPAGSMGGLRVHVFPEIRPGNAAMYYPEANAVVSRNVDPKSRTPAFKCVVVRVEGGGRRVEGRGARGESGGSRAEGVRGTT